MKTMPRSLDQALMLASQKHGSCPQPGVAVARTDDRKAAAVYLTGKPIVLFREDGLVLSTCGMARGSQLKDIINSCLPMTASRLWRLVQRNYDWILEEVDRSSGEVRRSVPFRDGITISRKVDVSA